MMLVAPLGAASTAEANTSICGLFVWNAVHHDEGHANFLDGTQRQETTLRVSLLARPAQAVLHRVPRAAPQPIALKKTKTISAWGPGSKA